MVNNGEPGREFVCPPPRWQKVNGLCDGEMASLLLFLSTVGVYLMYHLSARASHIFYSIYLSFLSDSFWFFGKQGRPSFQTMIGVPVCPLAPLLLYVFLHAGLHLPITLHTSKLSKSPCPGLRERVLKILDRGRAKNRAKKSIK